MTLDLRQLRLKDRTRQLQKAIGGVHDAGRVTGKGHSQHGRYQSATDPDFATVSDVVLMEAVAPRDAAWPPLTRLLCELAGGVFMPLPDHDVASGVVADDLVRLVTEFGELCAATGSGLADGTLQLEELLKIKREGLDVQGALALLLQHIDTLIDTQPANIAGVRRASDAA